MKIFFLLIIVFLICQIVSIKEEFQGMNYIQQHDYLKCCNNHGSCQAAPCQRFLAVNRSPMHLIGLVTQKNNLNNVYQLYSRRDLNSNDDEYFVKIYNDNDDYLHKKINKKYLYNNDEVIINNKPHIVTLYDNDNNYINYPNNRFFIENPYVGRKYYYQENPPFNHVYNNPIYNRYVTTPGYLYDSAEDNYNLLYKRDTGRNRWKYYLKKDDIFIPLPEYENKEIYDDDKITFNNKELTFKEYDN